MTAPRNIRLPKGRLAALLSVAVFSSLFGPLSSGATSQTQSSATLLAKVRSALGGPDRLQAIRRITLSGTMKRLVVGGTEAGSFRQSALEIAIALPDSYKREEAERLGSGTVTHISGFRGDKLLNEVRASGPDMHFGGSWGPEQIEIERTQFARLLLGTLALDTPTVPLTFAPASARKSAGESDLELHAIGPRGFAARLVVDRRTFRPSKLCYQTEVHLPAAKKAVPGTSPGAQGVSVATLPPAETREVQLRFSDWRTVDGVRFPHRIVKAVGDVILEEIVLDKVVIEGVVIQ